MKNIFLFIISIMFFLGASANAQYKWTDVQYHYQTGSVAPQYYYEYDIYIGYTGVGSVAFRTGYGSDTSSKVYTYNFQMTDKEVESLNKAIKKSKVLTSTFEELEKHPIGGSMQKVFITLPQDPRFDRKPTRIETPYFPASEKQKKALEKLYDKIKSYVPQSIWDEIESKKNK
jgi:hypothetical protein